MYGRSYAIYHARCWAEGKSAEEIRTEISRVEAGLYRTRDWQEVGNASDDATRIDVLTVILDQKQKGD